MKRKFALVLAGVLVTSMFTGCGAKTTSSGDTFEPKKNVEWVVTSSPGGGSDIYTRVITDIMTKEDIVSTAFVVNNQTDGGGEVGRNRVSSTTGDANTLLTFNSGDLTPMVTNTKLRIEDFTPIAVMAVDKQLMFIGENPKYSTMEEAIEAAKKGETVIVGGSKGDDVATFEKFLKSVSMTQDQITYVMYDSTAEAITGLLGGHIDMCMSKPAAAKQYVESGDMSPVLALSKSRFNAPFDAAPILSEIGYEDVEVPVWRGVVGPKDMPAKAVEFWSNALKQVAESESWEKDYISKYLLIPNFLTAEEAGEFMKQYQENYLATLK